MGFDAGASVHVTLLLDSTNDTAATLLDAVDAAESTEGLVAGCTQVRLDPGDSLSVTVELAGDPMIETVPGNANTYFAVALLGER